MNRTDVLNAVHMLASEGEAPTADRLATHIGLMFQHGEPAAAEVETALDVLIVQGKVRRLRVFASDRPVETGSDWIMVFRPM